MFKAVRNFSDGNDLFFIEEGNHKLLFKKLLIPIKKIMPPKTVLIPGIDTGIRNIIDNIDANINKPSFPNRFIISDNVRFLSGILLIIFFT